MKHNHTLEQEIEAILDSLNQAIKLETRHDFFALLSKRIQKSQASTTPKNR